MVNQRDDNREDFIIDGNYAAEEKADLTREEYYERSSEVFQKKSIMPFVIGGLGLVALWRALGVSGRG